MFGLKHRLQQKFPTSQAPSSPREMHLILKLSVCKRPQLMLGSLWGWAAVPPSRSGGLKSCFVSSSCFLCCFFIIWANLFCCWGCFLSFPEPACSVWLVLGFCVRLRSPLGLLEDVVTLWHHWCGELMALELFEGRKKNFKQEKNQIQSLCWSHWTVSNKWAKL